MVSGRSVDPPDSNLVFFCLNRLLNFKEHLRYSINYTQAFIKGLKSKPTSNMAKTQNQSKYPIFFLIRYNESFVFSGKLDVIVIVTDCFTSFRAICSDSLRRKRERDFSETFRTIYHIQHEIFGPSYVPSRLSFLTACMIVLNESSMNIFVHFMTVSKRF